MYVLNREERSTQQIDSRHRGSRYGEGIYTAGDAQSFSDYGDVGLMLVRLKGVEMDSEEAERGYSKGNNSIDDSLNDTHRRLGTENIIEGRMD